jgi:hypothetical protein
VGDVGKKTGQPWVSHQPASLYGRPVSPGSEGRETSESEGIQFVAHD